MKIGLLSYRSHPYSGGQGIYLKHLSLALLNLGHEVDVLSGPPYPDLHKDINLIKISSLNLFELEDNLRLRSFRSRFFLNSTDLIEWLGVLSGGFPEPYTFGRRVDSYLKDSLIKYVENVVDMGKSVKYSSQAQYRTYRRAGRNDLLTMVELSEIKKNCKHFVWEK